MSTKKFLIAALAAILAATPVAAQHSVQDLDDAMHVSCASHKATDWHSELWNVIMDYQDVLRITCATRTVYEECVRHPRMTLGQAFATVLYNIEFGRKAQLPQFVCGA